MAKEYDFKQRWVNFKLTKNHKNHRAPKTIATDMKTARALEAEGKGYLVEEGQANLDHKNTVEQTKKHAENGDEEETPKEPKKPWYKRIIINRKIK